MINEILNSININDIKEIKKFYSNQNDVYEVITNNRNYTLKIYSKDAIKNEEDYLYREEQFKYGDILKNKNINVILPIKINNKFINKYKDLYFCLYNTLIEDKDNIDYRNLVKLFIDSHIKNDTLNINKHYKKTDMNIDCLNELFNKSNYYTDNIKDLYLFQNDFKPLNILWVKSIPYLIDFDATGYSNINANLIEFAINFSYKDNKLDYKIMNKIYRLYEELTNTLLDNFDEAFYLSLNGKISWMSYCLSKYNNEDISNSSLLYFYNNRDDIKTIYLNHNCEY